MEKIKVNIDYSNSDCNNDDDKYTFVLPGNKYKDITITSNSQKDSNTKKKNHSDK